MRQKQLQKRRTKSHIAEDQCFDCDDIDTNLVTSEFGNGERVCPGCEARRTWDYGLPPATATGASSALLCEIWA